MQMVAVLWILLKWDETHLPLLILATGLCTGGSGLLYVWDGTRQLSAHPTSLAIPVPGPPQPGPKREPPTPT